MSDEFLPEPVKFPKRKTQKISTGHTFIHEEDDDGEGSTMEVESSIDVAIITPTQPAPVFHDPPDENVIDGDLDIATTNLRNLCNLWPAVRSVEQACKLAQTIDSGLANRRKLANKQLGTKEGGPKGNIYTVPSD